MKKVPPVHTQRLIDFQCIASRFISLGYAIREFGREGYRSCPAILSDDRRRRSRVNLTISTQRLICFKYFTTLIKSKFNESKSLDVLLDFKKNWVEQIAKKTSRIRYSFQLSVPLFILFNFIAFTSHAQSFLDAKQSGKDLANSLLIQVQNNTQQDINNKNPATNTSVAESINFKGTDIPERNYAHENMDAAKNQKAADKSNIEASIVSTSFLRAKEYPISLSNSFLDKANDAQKNPENYVDWLSGKYTDCNQEGGEEVLSKSSHTCDEFKEIKDNICSVGRSIQVDSKHKYICPRKINKFEKTCTKSLIVAIDKQENCNAGAIEYLRVEGINRASDLYNVKWNYSYPSLSVSITTTALHDYHPYPPPTTSKKILFNIKDKSLISIFMLNKLEIQGVASILLNGHLVYGTAGYPYIQTEEFIHSDRPDGGRSHYYINGIPWKQFPKSQIYTAPSKDLLSYLKDGKNELTIVGIPIVYEGSKLTNISIETKQRCIHEKESWLEQCNEAGL